MNIIPYEPRFHDQIIKLWTAVFPNDPPWNKPNVALEEKLRHQPELLFLAVETDQLIGTILAGYDGHRGWIYAMAVDNSYRGQGIASALMQKAELILAELGCIKVNLQVRADNGLVQEFYKKNGYEIEERISMGKRLGRFA